MKQLRILLIAMLLALGLAVLTALIDPAANPQGSIPGSTLIISEICAKNDSILADNNGKFRDYIELYNSGEAVDLTGYTLTDGKHTSRPLDGIFLEQGAYRVFFLGDTDTGFSLGSSGGDCVQLLTPQGEIAAQATVASLLSDQVMLHSTTGYTLSYDATPGFSNDAAGLAAFRKGSPATEPKLLISEIMIANGSAWPGPQGRFPDVIELYNASSEYLSLDGYYLSDDPGQRFAFRLPAGRLGPGEYLLICCDGENRVDEIGTIHTNFALSHGETLVLTDSRGAWLSAELALPEENRSLIPGEDGTWSPGEVSLGYRNDAQGAMLYAQDRFWEEAPLVISEVLLSSAGVPYEGTFRDVAEIRNRSDAPVSTAGWYLSDGEDPFRYPLPEATLEPGEYLVIPCTPQTTGFALSAGETLLLTAPDYRLASSVSCVSGEPGSSMQHQSDNAYGFGPASLGFGDSEAFQAAQLPEDLQFSELMSANTSYLKGPYGTTCDWLELYNGSGQALSLSEYCLTDSKGDLSRYPLPERILEPGEYCLLLLSQNGENLLKGYDVLPMNLSADGETLYLSRKGEIVDYVFLPALSQNISYGRSGSGPYTTLHTPTPGSANSDGARMAAIPTANFPQGSYDGVEGLDIVLTGEGTVYYTTDCTVPTRYSRRYTEPIHLTKTTVIRAVCIPENGIPSEVLDLTYLINENDQLATVCIVTSPENLWDNDTGIYVEGDGAQEAEPHYGANYWNDWEKAASISLFEAEGGGFSANCGIRIFGYYSRAEAKKSLACFFRDSYGDGELNYPVFGENSLDKYESLILRSSGQDVFTARMRDVLITSLVSDHTDVPVQDYRPVVVYLNGEYWGLHYIREKLNTHYVAGHYNMDPEEVHPSVLDAFQDSRYTALRSFVMRNDMSDPENYAYVCSQMDIDNYIDYYIAQTWIANFDIMGNIKFFLNEEGKWTWILFDTDLSMYNAGANRIQENLDHTKVGGSDLTGKTFGVYLMENPEFRDKYLTRMAWQMNNIWTEENVIDRIDEIQSMIIGDMEKECRRWRTSYDYWLECVEALRTFARKRNANMLLHIQQFFGFTDKQMRDYGFKI